MLFLNGELALPGAEAPVRGSLRSLNGKIVEIGPELEPLPDEDLVNATGLLILPGGIDPHVHFDTPGFESREDFLHGTAEAARGGTTTVIDMPCTSLPPVVDAAALESKLAVLASQAVVDYGLFGGVRGATAPSDDGIPQRMAELAGKVLGFKCYLLSGMETFPRVSHEELEQAVKAADELGRPLLVHAEDADYVRRASGRLKAARGDGQAIWDDYVDSRPEMAEIVACAAALALAGGRERSLHIVHVGTADAAEALWVGGASCETCIHYLAFSRDDFAAKGSALKTAPPVKGRVQAERLWAQLAEGRIAFVASDHAPATKEEKRTGSVWTDYGGIPGVGTRLPYLFSEGYLAGRLSLDRFLETSAAAAARRFGLFTRKGSIEIGKDADLVLMDKRAETMISAERFYSKGRDTPFEGMKLRGAVRSTWVRGRLVYDALEDAAGRAANVFMGAGRRKRCASPLAEQLREFAPGIVAEPGFGKFLEWDKA